MALNFVPDAARMGGTQAAQKTAPISRSSKSHRASLMRLT
jgi:hypothetical protein